MSDRNELIAQFVSMTNAPESQAQFYLEMSQWNLEVAVSQFFDSAGAAATAAGEAQTVPSGPTPAAPTTTPASSSSAAAPAKRKPVSSKIRTLSDMNNNDSDDDEEHENLYAGGEKSGMVVQGPNRKGGNGNNLVDEILKKAAEGRPPSEEPETARVKKPAAYTGSGYRLGSEDEPSTIAQPASPVAPPAAEEDSEPVTRHLTFWRDGFSVDDGPLYAYTDPANQQMLTAINSGRAPLSLLNVRHGQPVEVRVVKRQDEDYTPPPKAPPKPFEGTGNRLGSPSAYVAPSTTTPGAFPSASSSSAAAPTVDESQPTTNIQVRLGDGSKLIAKLNHTHTIGDLRQFIESSQPASRPYTLQTTFPVKELKDNNQTIKEAGLLNSVVVQRYQ